MNKLILFLLLSCSLLCSCNSGQASKTTESQAANSADPIVTPKESAVKNTKSLRSSALSILNHRIKQDPEIYAAVEAGVWEYQFVFDGKKMSGPGAKDGNWTDFKDDHSYTYGKYAILQGTGKYHFKLDEMKLLMVDDNPAYPPQEWDIKLAGNAMVMIGNQIYGNSAYQIKLIHHDEVPVAPSTAQPNNQ